LRRKINKQYTHTNVTLIPQVEMAPFCVRNVAKISPDDHSELDYSKVDIVNELGVKEHPAEKEPETNDVHYFVHI
jgi:hypothetical protein